MGSSALYTIAWQHETPEGTFATRLGTAEGKISDDSALGTHASEVECTNTQKELTHSETHQIVLV